MAFLITGEPAISSLALSLPESVVDQVEVSRARSTRSLRVAGKPPQRALRLVGWRNCEFDMRRRLVWRTDTHLIVRSTVVLALVGGPCVVISWMRDIRFLAGREGCQGAIGKKWDDGLTFVVTHFNPVRCVDRSHHRHHHIQNKVMMACARNGWH